MSSSPRSTPAEPTPSKARGKRRAAGEGNISYHKTLGLYQVKVPTGQYDDQGKMVFKYGARKTKDDAVQLKKHLERQIADNALPEAGTMTVADLMRLYLERAGARVKPRTLELYTTDAERFILPALGGVRLLKLTPLQIERMQADVLHRVSADAAAKARATLARALRQAVRWRLITSSPTDGVEPVKVQRQDMGLWEPEQVPAFLEHVRGHRLYALFYLALTTGMRQGELVALHWSDLALTGPQPSLLVRFSSTTVKNKAALGDPKTPKGSRRLALSPDQVQVLEAHRLLQAREREALAEGWTERGLVFPSTVGTLQYPGPLNKTWRALRDSSTLPPIRFHDLRHTYASLAVRAGMDVRLLADRLGHRNPAFTLRYYTHLFERHRLTGAMSLEALLVLPTAPPPPSRPPEAAKL